MFVKKTSPTPQAPGPLVDGAADGPDKPFSSEELQGPGIHGEVLPSIKTSLAADDNPALPSLPSTASE